MRKSIGLLALLTALFLLCSCSAQPIPEEKQISFTDSMNYTVSLGNAPETVAVLFSSYAEIWNLAGGTVSVTVGESVERGFASAETLLVDDGAGKTIDMELLLAAQPDFVIGSADIDAQVEACGLLRQAGIPAALFRVDTFSDYLSMLKICTQITGNAQAYETHGTAVKERIDANLAAAQTQQSQQKVILFIRAGSQYSSTKANRAPDNFVCIMLDELGAHNIADEAEVLLDGLSLEEILLQDPAHIFLTTMGSEQAAVSYIGELFSQDGWKDMTAVKQEQYTFLEKELFHFKPNARWAEAYELLAKLLYPELKLGE